jgi:hypothetical protein
MIFVFTSKNSFVVSWEESEAFVELVGRRLDTVEISSCTVSRRFLYAMFGSLS